MGNLPRVTFGIIVLNGEPFVRYNLRALYPYAHQIIVVEGAVEGAVGIASPDGHSTDTTLETLRDFKVNEDRDDKVTIITREGFWSEKDEMSQVYAEHATGDYLWQVDIDEFYHPEDIEKVLSMLGGDPSISMVSFKQITFWGGFEIWVDSWYLRSGSEMCHRIFKWGYGYQYITHRPPTVVDDKGQDTRNGNWIHGDNMAEEGVLMFHYSLLLPKQVQEKCDYYSAAPWAKQARQSRQWAKEAYLELRRPYRVHNVYRYPSWLERFTGTHPPQILAMQADLDSWYQIGRAGLKLTFPIGRLLIHIWRFWLPDFIKRLFDHKRIGKR
jgi:hypothetical protein